MSNLSSAQFDQHLPGLSEAHVAGLHTQNSKDSYDYEPSDKEWAESTAARETRWSRELSTEPLKDRWSGHDPGQLLMGVHDLAENNGQFDVHGFVNERPPSMRGELDPVHPVPHVVTPDKGTDGPIALDYLQRYGGRNSESPAIRMHWSQFPPQDVSSKTLIHTLQSSDETELGHAAGDGLNAVLYRSQFPGRREGRERLNNIRSDVEQGHPIRTPAHLIKLNDRLFALDGHHRIAAAREAGAEHFPARIWDIDAENKNKA